MVVLEARLDALEPRVDALEVGASQMRQDWKDIQQTQIRLLNSLRETQVEHGQTLVEHGRMLTELRGDVTELRGDMTEIRGDMTELRLGMAGIVRSLDYLIKREQARPPS